MNKFTNLDVICLTGGKCGSTSLEKTLQKNGYKTIRTHSPIEFKHKFGFDGLYNVIKNNSLNNKKLFIIDSYRLPIERKISSFFENINSHVPNHTSLNCNQLINIFNKKCLYTIEEYHPIDNAMINNGISPFEEFNFKNNYVIKEDKNVVFIKILFSDINNWDTILSKIFNKKINIHKYNLTSNKSIHLKYIRFKTQYKVPKLYLNNYLKKDKNFKIYNTQQNQKLYLEKWYKNSY